MRDGFESYRAELDSLRLTAESKAALAEGLVRRRIGKERESRHGRFTALLRQAAVAAAVVSLLAAVGGAVVVSGVPTMRDRFFGGDSVGYTQSGGFVGTAVENNGWTLSITDCVGDDYYVYLGMELEAPEGTVLDASDYKFRHISAKFTDSSLYGSYWVVPLPDEDPTDNRLPLMWLLYSSQPGVNGATVRLKLSDLGHHWDYDRDRGERYALDCGGTWDFGYVTVDYPDSTLRLEPNTPVKVSLEGAGGVRELDAAISQIHISPLALYVWTSGQELILHHGPEKPQPDETYYDCHSLQEVQAFDRNGSPIPLSPGVDAGNWNNYAGTVLRSSRTGSGGCSGYSEKEGYIWQTFGFQGLMDVNRVAKIVVNGVEIAVQ